MQAVLHGLTTGAGAWRLRINSYVAALAKDKQGLPVPPSSFDDAGFMLMMRHDKGKKEARGPWFNYMGAVVGLEFVKLPQEPVKPRGRKRAVSAIDSLPSAPPSSVQSSAPSSSAEASPITTDSKKARRNLQLARKRARLSSNAHELSAGQNGPAVPALLEAVKTKLDGERLVATQKLEALIADAKEQQKVDRQQQMDDSASMRNQLGQLVQLSTQTNQALNQFCSMLGNVFGASSGSGMGAMMSGSVSMARPPLQNPPWTNWNPH